MRLLTIPSLQRPIIRKPVSWQRAISGRLTLQKLPGTTRCLTRCAAATNGKEKIAWIQTRSKVRFCHDQRRSSSRAGYMTTCSVCMYMLGILEHDPKMKGSVMQDVLTTALEAGLSTLLFDSASTELQEEWKQIGRFTALTVSEDGDILEDSKKVCTLTLHTQLYD